MITRDLPEGIPYDDNEALALRDYASDLVGLIVQKTISKSPQIMDQIVNLLINKIISQDPVQTGLAFYGCLSCLRVFGYIVTKKFTIP